MIEYKFLRQVKKWRSIYYTMSKFNVNDTRTGFIAEGWVRTCDLDNVKQALKRGAVSTSNFCPSCLGICAGFQVLPIKICSAFVLTIGSSALES